MSRSIQANAKQAESAHVEQTDAILETFAFVQQVGSPAFDIYGLEIRAFVSVIHPVRVLSRVQAREGWCRAPRADEDGAFSSRYEL